jgi:hypothetical protein
MPKSLRLTKRQQGWLIGAVGVVLLIIGTSALDATPNGVAWAFVTGLVGLGLVGLGVLRYFSAREAE